MTLSVSNLSPDAIAENYEKYGFWISFSIIFITLLLPILFNPQKLKEFIDIFSYARGGSTRGKEKALESPYLDSLTRKSIQKKIAEDYFYQSIGMRIDFYMRYAVLSLCEYSHGSITLYSLKKARIHLFYDDNKLKVSLSSFERFSGKISFFFFVVFIFGALALTSYLIVSLTDSDFSKISSIQSSGSIIGGIIYILVTLFGAFIFLNIYSEVKSAEKIEKYLNDNPDFNNEYLKELPIFDVDANSTKPIENQNGS